MQLPSSGELAASRFWNFKIPVFAKLVEPPHATPEARGACIEALFGAAEAVEHSPNRPASCRVACLITTPFLFESEVTLFPDEDYFESFLPPGEEKRTELDHGWIEASPADAAAIADILPEAPKGLAFEGGTLLRELDGELGDRLIERINWVWAYPRR